MVDGALAALGVPAGGRPPVTRVVAGAMVGLILDDLVGDPGPRPDPELDLISRLIADAAVKT